jgi:hypothetical protein
MIVDFIVCAGVLLLALLALGLWRALRALAQMAESQARLREASQALAQQQAREAGERHTELQGCMRELLAAQARQEQRNLEALSAALAGVIDDFNRRITRQFDAQLQKMTAMAASSLELHQKQRTGQMEAMHEARRSATQMQLATDAFAAMMAEASALAALAGDVRRALVLIEPRQDDIDASMAEQTRSLQAVAEDLAALRASLEQSADQLAGQFKRAIDSIGQRTLRNNNALGKELGDALNKAIAGVGKQMAAVSSRMSMDIAPVAQQLKRVTEQSRINR